MDEMMSGGERSSEFDRAQEDDLSHVKKHWKKMDAWIKLDDLRKLGELENENGQVPDFTPRHFSNEEQA